MRGLAPLLLLLSLAGACYAADETTDETEDERAQGTSTAEQTTAAEDSTANPAETEDTEAADAGPTIRDNDDFIPTVQISEDLSVSFPVDI